MGITTYPFLQMISIRLNLRFLALVLHQLNYSIIFTYFSFVHACKHHTKKLRKMFDEIFLIVSNMELKPNNYSIY